MLIFLTVGIFIQSVCSQTVSENSINLNSHFTLDSKICNIYDEAHYCQQIVIDRRMELVAISHKCICPGGYKCPNDTEDTYATTYCAYEDNRGWHKCHMRCVPTDI